MVNIDQGKDADKDLNTIFDPSARAVSEMVGGSDELMARSEGLSQFASDMRFILIDKAEGDIYLKMVNSCHPDGVLLHAVAYKWFT